MPEAWDKMENEPSLWFKRFVLYRNLGADRTLLGAVHKAEKSRKKQSAKTPGAWNDAYEQWQWKSRAKAYDAAIYAEQERNAAILRQLEQDEIERILTTDYAAKHERVKALARMAHTVEKSFIDEETQDVNFKFMSPDKLREWRGMLDDIAKELGDRVKEARVTGKDGGPIEITTVWGGAVVEDE